MARGALELASIPVVYQVRHLPPRRKQAVTSTICEETVHRIPSWSSVEAPAVVQVATEHDQRIAYRACYGGDGVLRLNAALGSAVFRGHAEHPADGRAPDFAGVRLFQHPREFASPVEALRGLGDDLGVIISSERHAALSRSSSIARTLCLVDGELHAPCPEPGWVLDVDTRRYFATGESVLAMRCCPDPYPFTLRQTDRFLPFCTDYQEVLSAAWRNTRWPVRVVGSIEQLVPGALSGDYLWRSMRDLVQKAVCVDASISNGMLEDELALRRALMSALANWPVQRDAALENAAVRLVRVVHSIRANGLADLLAATLDLRENLRRHPAPLSFASRMAISGLGLPDREAADDCGNAPANAFRPVR